jgi:crotonobetainyl-CoA:carnitine CoA-transferase CaiB-like acyl-CoA transferase
MLQLGSAIIPEGILHYQIAGSELPRQGPTDVDAVFSGVYETADLDVWVAVSVRSAIDAGRLRKMLPYAQDAGAADASGLEATLASWLKSRRAADAVAALQGAGIPAGQVLDVGDLFQDPHLAQRDVFETVRLGIGEDRVVVGRPYRFLTTKAAGGGPRIRRPSPDFGADNRYVLSEILGLGDDAIHDLYRRGVVAERPVDPPAAEPTDLQSMLARGDIARLDQDYRSRASDKRPTGR